MGRSKVLWHIAALSLYGIATAASAQLAPPILEVDFTTLTVPLSPTLSLAIAIAIALVALFMLRRARRGAGLMSWAIVLGAVPLAYALMHVPIVSQAHALPPPPIVLPLTSSPVIVTGPQYFDYIHATNVTGSSIIITAVKYDTGGYDFYVDAATTTCVPGLTLTPGTFCIIRILSLG